MRNLPCAPPYPQSYLDKYRDLLSDEKNSQRLADPLVKWRRGSVEALSTLARRCVLLAGRLRPTAKQLVRALEPWELVAKPSPAEAPPGPGGPASPSPLGRRVGIGSGGGSSGGEAALYRHQSTPVVMGGSGFGNANGNGSGSGAAQPSVAVVQGPSPRPSALIPSSRARSQGANLLDLDDDDSPLAGAERLLRVKSSDPGTALDGSGGSGSRPASPWAQRRASGAAAGPSGVALAAAGRVGSGSSARGSDDLTAAENLCIVCLANPRVSCRHLQLCTECSGGGGAPPPGFCPGCGAVDLDWSARPPGAADGPHEMARVRVLSPLHFRRPFGCPCSLPRLGDETAAHDLPSDPATPRASAFSSHHRARACSSGPRAAGRTAGTRACPRAAWTSTRTRRTAR